VVSPEEAEIVYDGPGEPVWMTAGKVQKNGQRSISLSRIKAIAAQFSACSPVSLGLAHVSLFKQGSMSLIEIVS
jgi:hypothetical protein